MVENVEVVINQLEQKINNLTRNFDCLYNFSKQLDTEVYELGKNIEKYKTNIIVSRIEEINRLEDFEYTGVIYKQYLVKFNENPSYYYLICHQHTTAPAVKELISHKIEGDRIKEWKKFK